MKDGEPKRAKRANGEGSYHEVAPDRWRGRAIIDGRPVDRYGKTRKEAMKRIREAQQEHEEGLRVGTKRQTVAAFLDDWLKDHVRPRLAPKTIVRYEDTVRLHLKPTIGDRRLNELTAQHVSAMLRSRLEAGKSPRTVADIRNVLQAALNHAIRLQIISRNVATLAPAPRVVATEVRPLTAEGAAARLAAATGDRLEAAFHLGLLLGLREGEVLGLKWEDVDLVNRRLTVRRAIQRVRGCLIEKEPKSAASRRRLAIPPTVAAQLTAHRDRQAFERQAAGALWTDDGYVFTTRTGGPVDPRNFIRSWHRIQIAAGLERRRFHDTRHTTASLLVAQGVGLKRVQGVMGHSKMSTTADLYAHLYDDGLEEPAAAIERAIAG